MSRRATAVFPPRPVRRAPALIGTGWPPSRPMRREKNMIGASGARKPPPVAFAKSKMPWPDGQGADLALPSACVEAPGLLLARRVAERLERDDHLRRPARLVAVHLHVPDGVPVVVRVVLVEDERVADRAERIGLEEKRRAAIVKRIEDDREVLVLKEAAVAAHLVGDHAIGCAVVHARGHVDVAVVEEHPHLRLLGRQLANLGLLLPERRRRFDRAVDRLVEAPVDDQRLRQANGANGDLGGLLRAGGCRGKDECQRDERRRTLRRHPAAASSIASFARRSASLLSSRRTCSNVTSPTWRARARACSNNGCSPGLLTRYSPRICFTSRSESARTWSVDIALAAAHRKAAIKPLYSATLFVVSPIAPLSSTTVPSSCSMCTP